MKPTSERRPQPRSSTVPTKSRSHAREWYWSRFDRESYTCPDCGRGPKQVSRFEVHHKDGDATNNYPLNLIALCSRCHVWRHETGPTISGLDLDEWKREFTALGG